MAAGSLRTTVVFSLLIAPAASATSLPVRPGDDVSERARRIHRDAIVVDSHIDAPMALREKWADLGVRGATPHFDIPRAREGGLTAPILAVFVPPEIAERGGAVKEALEIIDLVRRAAAAHPGDVEMAARAEDVRRIKGSGKMAFLMGLEGGHAIDDSLAVLRALYGLGIRYMTLTHANTNRWADSAGAPWLPDYDPEVPRVHHGLTDFGRSVIREMNRLGMMVDVSHASDETVDDVLAVSRAPIFASHSGCRALCDVPRNLDDDRIRRIARAGGLVMVDFSSEFLDQKATDIFRDFYARIRPEYVAFKERFAGDREKREAAIRELLGTAPYYRTSLAKVIDHIEHVIRVAGPDAVGIGSDFDGTGDVPDGLEDASKYPGITEELLRRGHSEEVVRKVLGENFLRFFARVEDVARSLSSEPPSTARVDD